MAKTPKAPRLKTPLMRVMFVNAYKAKAQGENGDGALKYGLCGIMDPDKFTATDKKRYDALVASLGEKMKEAFKTEWKLGHPSLKTGIRRNRERVPPFEGFGPKALFVNLTSDYKPGVCDINGNAISPEEGNEELLYRGCYVVASVNSYSFETKGNKGVGLGLNNIQVIKDGPRLDNRQSAAEEFGDDEVDSEWLEGDEESVEDEEDY